MKNKLILLHGALGCGQQLTRLIKPLKSRFDVHIVNFEGHGGRPSNHDFSMKRFADNVIEYMEAQSLEDVLIVGYSMGGYVALTLALQHPESVRKVVTLGTKFNWEMEAAQKEIKMLNPAKVEEKIPHFATYLEQLHQPEDWRLVMTKTAKMMEAMARGARLFDADFKQIDLPVVIGIGSEDNIVTYDESAYVADLIPNATLVSLPGVKHPIDQVETEVLVEFIGTYGG